MPRYPIIRQQQIFRKLAKPGKQYETLAYNNVKSKVFWAKEGMLEAFDEHLVTQEIQGGPTADNISNTLSSSMDTNLYSFIGFEENPIPSLRAFLEKKTQLLKTPSRVRSKIAGNSSTIDYWFRVKVPSLPEIYKATPYPAPNMKGSWVRGIERGIFGFRHFLFKLTGFGSASRSGTGIEAKIRGTQTLAPIRDREYQTTNYLSKILEVFVRRLGKK